MVGQMHRPYDPEGHVIKFVLLQTVGGHAVPCMCLFVLRTVNNLQGT